MENGEIEAQEVYSGMTASVPEAADIMNEEDAHEHQLLDMIDEERLKYVGSIVLGLNDALVELTGALAGLTFALANPRLVATAGVITGIAGAMSMSASAFLSAKSESGGKNPAKAAIYTGITYISTVTVLVLPYLLLNNLLLSLGIMLVSTVVVILVFTFYVSVAKNLDFRKRFLEMVSISLGVAALSFIIGFGVRGLLHIE
jgi:VIT1/CCC1 family predicted Fe2+/Mn2+ transporter